MRINPQNLVPMSMEQPRMARKKNSRRYGLLQLYLVDGLGNEWILINSEIEKWGLDTKWPRYMKSNLGIKTINRMRREAMR